MNKGINQTRGLPLALVGAVCALVIGVYAWSAKSGWLEMWSVKAENSYYNLLVQGFRDGQLNLKREVPPGLAQLADPYDPLDNSPYLSVENPLLDLSYYKGKLFLYFGVTPAVALFWPYAALTGYSLLNKEAVVIFFSVAFLASVGLLWGMWRRYFPEVSVWVVAAGALALGWANFTLACLQRCDVYEVTISCGYALTMVTLTLLWKALHAARWQAWWLAGASLAYGLAVGARPSLLFGAVILLVPVAMAWRERGEPGKRRQVWPLLLAAAAPIVVIGLGLMLYNYLRFDHALEFGQRYQLSPGRQSVIEQFSPRYLWFNFWVGFLAPARWSGYFPFVQDIALPAMPKGSTVEQLPFGILSNIPLVWLALAAPLAWRRRLPEGRSALRYLGAALALLFGTCALTLGLHNSMNLRYELEFLPVLVLLAVIGIFGVEHALAGRLIWQRAARWGWGLLLAFSVSLNWCAMFERSAETYAHLGRFFARHGRAQEAVVQFEKALKMQPGNGQIHADFGMSLLQQGRVPEGIGQLEEAVRLKPDCVAAHQALGKALSEQGKVAEAREHFEQVVRLLDYPEAHTTLGLVLLRQGKLSEARAHLARAVQLKPDYAEAHNHLAAVLVQLAELPEAIQHLEEAVRLEPKYAGARSNLSKVLFQFGEQLAAQGQWYKAVVQYKRVLQFEPGRAQVHESLALALCQRGQYEEAVQHYKKVLAKNPRSLTALNNLAWVLATCPDGKVRNGTWAVGLARKASSLAEDKDTGILDTLAAAYAEAGRFGEAVKTAEAALELVKRPEEDEKAKRIEGRLALYHAKRPYREGAVSLTAPTATGKQKARTASRPKATG